MSVLSPFSLSPSPPSSRASLAPLYAILSNINSQSSHGSPGTPQGDLQIQSSLLHTSILLSLCIPGPGPVQGDWEHTDQEVGGGESLPLIVTRYSVGRETPFGLGRMEYSYLTLPGRLREGNSAQAQNTSVQKQQSSFGSQRWGGHA